MLETFKSETFKEHVGSTFTLRAGEDTLELELVECNGLSGDRGEREPFSLLFRSAADALVLLEQHIVALDHDALGTVELFLVPLGPDAEGRRRYEAVFT